MSQCSQNPTIRIAKIRENQKTQKSKENEEGFDNEVRANRIGSNMPTVILPEQAMTDVLYNIEIIEEEMPSNIENNPMAPTGGIPPAPVPPSSIPGGGVGLPQVLPNAPNLRVPPNPLLPKEYQEMLNYNDLQFSNGFFRTQIGHYVRVDCLVGSTEIVNKYGYLIGVGINYILLQDAVTNNVTSVDFWSIKFMYIYYDIDELKKVIPFI